jgi:hypothetical protein
MTLVLGLLLVVAIFVMQQTKDVEKGNSETLKTDEIKQENNLNTETRPRKTRDNTTARVENNFIINKKLLAAGEDKINFPKQCHYQEKTNEDGVEEGFVFSYVSKEQLCPYLVIKSKNVKIKDGYWGLVWVERKNGKIHQTYGGDKQLWQKVGERIYKSTIYTNIECFGSIETSIVYESSKKSILDFAYIQVYSKESGFGEGNFDDICEPNQHVVDAKVDSISKKEHKAEVEFLQKMFENK